MPPWGGLNPALTAWRIAINALFPNRSRASDGGYADPQHGSTSQHQPDSDGTVDAFDQDVNLLGSSIESGDPNERRLMEALKLDFENDPHGRGYLWIHMYEIANADVGDWRERPYTGSSNPHDKHAHWQTRQSKETDGRPWPLPRTAALLEEITMPSAAEIAAALRPVIRSEVRAELTSQLDDIARAVGSLPVDIETDQPGVNNQPWSRVDAYARDERAAIQKGINAILAKLNEAPPAP